jgi:hypothetical protein
MCAQLQDWWQPSVPQLNDSLRCLLTHQALRGGLSAHQGGSRSLLAAMVNLTAATLVLAPDSGRDLSQALPAFTHLAGMLHSADAQ